MNLRISAETSSSQRRTLSPAESDFFDDLCLWLTLHHWEKILDSQPPGAAVFHRPTEDLPPPPKP